MAARRLLTLLALCATTSMPGCRDEGTGLETVAIGDRTFHLEVAVGDETVARGLKDRTEVPADGGMLFVFPEVELRRFWMEDCLVDIDIIFLDAGGRVTAMHHMKAEPPMLASETRQQYQARLPGYSSGYPAQYAIELRAGTLEKLDLHLEDRIELDRRRLERLAAKAAETES